MLSRVARRSGRSSGGRRRCATRATLPDLGTAAGRRRRRPRVRRRRGRADVGLRGRVRGSSATVVYASSCDVPSSPRRSCAWMFDALDAPAASAVAIPGPRPLHPLAASTGASRAARGSGTPGRGPPARLPAGAAPPRPVVEPDLPRGPDARRACAISTNLDTTRHSLGPLRHEMSPLRRSFLGLEERLLRPDPQQRVRRSDFPRIRRRGTGLRSRRRVFGRPGRRPPSAPRRSVTARPSRSARRPRGPVELRAVLP